MLVEALADFANSFRVPDWQKGLVTQGVAPGWNWLTPSAFTTFGGVVNYVSALERPG